MHITGSVTNVESKNITLKTGPRAGSTAPVYTLVVDGKRIDAGFKKPSVVVGGVFSGEIADSPDRWGVYKMVKSGTTGVTSAVSSTVDTQPAFKPRSGFPIPKSDHATSICRQSALKAAVDMTCMLVNNGTLAGSEVTPESVLEVAAIFANWTTGQAEVEAAERILRGETHEVAG